MTQGPLREVGSYILEVAGVVMGLSVFMVGGADIARLYQARSAVRAAVNDGVRCLYPTDATCSTTSNTTWSPPSRSFNVWVRGQGYQIPRESYLASARWLTEPVYQATKSTERLTALTLQEDQFQYTPYQPLYPTTAHAVYLLQTRSLPSINGGTPLNPTFVNPDTNRVETPSLRISAQSVKGGTAVGPSSSLPGEYNPLFEIGSVSFGVRGAWGAYAQDRVAIAALPETTRRSLPCYRGKTRTVSGTEVLQWSAGHPQPCRYRSTDARASQLMLNGEMNIPMMLRVTGSTLRTDRDGQGKVVMTLSWQRGAQRAGPFELGGRVFGFASIGDFVPRGLALEDIQRDRASYAPYAEELSLYRELPRIPVDATVTLTFYLMSTNGKRVAWQGREVEVYYPSFQFVHEQFECGYSNNPAGCASPPSKVLVGYIAPKSGGIVKATTSGADQCSVTRRSEAESDLTSALAKMQRSFESGVSVSSSPFYVQAATNPAICAPQNRRVVCKSGATIEAFRGCSEPSSAEELVSLCGVQSAGPTAPRVVELIRGPSIESVERRRGCSDAALPRCARTSVVDRVPLELGSVCANVEQSVAAQIVVGPMHQNACIDRTRDVERLYRTQEKIPLHAPVTVTRLPAPSIFSADKPADTCVPFASLSGSGQEVLCGAGISSAAADRCCQAAGGLCRREQVTTGSSTNTNAKSSVLQVAERRVVEAVQAGYPAARHQVVCAPGETDCLEVRASVSEADAKATVTAKVQVPLTLIPYVSGGNATVEHSVTRVLERSMVR